MGGVQKIRFFFWLVWKLFIVRSIFSGWEGVHFFFFFGGGGVQKNSDLSSFQVTEFPSFQVSKEGWREDQREAWNWSCDLRANERPWGKKLHLMAQTDIQTSRHPDIQTWQLYDQLGSEGPSWWKDAPGHNLSIGNCSKNIIKVLEFCKNKLFLSGQKPYSIA